MISTNSKIIVRVDDEQKSSIDFGNIKLSTAIKYDTNYREKSPVIATVVAGNKELFKDDILICHHNMFYLPSPHHLQDDLFSIPCGGNVVFAKVRSNGNLVPVCGNLFCERIEKPSLLPLPPEKIELYTDRVRVIDEGGTNYKKGDLLFTRPYSYYEIVYVFNGVEKRVHKCHEKNVCGVEVLV